MSSFFVKRAGSWAVLMAFCLAGSRLPAQPKGFNYDESKVGTYTLPDPLTALDGSKVSSARQWTSKRRAEILGIFEREMFGQSPKRPAPMRFVVKSTDQNALGGKAERKEVTIYFTGETTGPKMDLLIYLPRDRKGAVPAFLGLNFKGNHAVNADAGITLPEQWTRDGKSKELVLKRVEESTRGSEASRWQAEKIVGRGYALATACYFDIEPDFPDAYEKGVRAIFHGRGKAATASEAPADDWGAIAAWAWGLSCALDYLETDRDIDAKKVAVMGHSRLGKTSLWAGVSDPRFAIVISNDSGEGGAALSRRWFGETVERINTSFPHWFNANYKKYNTNVTSLPMDQHMLLALVAPRPLYVASASEDQWADPRGEFLAAKGAEAVYALFGKKGLGVDEMPAIDHPVGDTIGYHIRTGKHDVTEYDWEQYLKFADRHFGK